MADERDGNNSRTRALLAAGGLLTTGVLASRRQEARRTDRQVSALLGAAESPSDRPVTDDADLPDPVRRYFETVLSPGRPHVRTAALTQRGEFRLGGVASRWHPLRATQHYTVDPPGFVWDATIRLGGVVPVTAVDSYSDGRGRLRARLLWAVPVADAGPSPTLAAAQLSRYLAEAVWFPTALLPTNGVEWMAIDGERARATLTHDGTTVSLTFAFDADGLVERVVATDRPRAVGTGYEPTAWTGYFDEYAEVDGLRVPTRAAVKWTLPESDLPYWRAEITDTTYGY